jgi:hypothetical protein
VKSKCATIDDRTFLSVKDQVCLLTKLGVMEEQVLGTGTLLAWEPSARELGSDMNQSKLKLVWVNATWLSNRKRTKRNFSSETDKPVNPFVRGWRWLRVNGSAISALVLFIAVPWYLGRFYVQLENTDQALYGDDGLVKRVNGLRNDVIWMRGFVTGTYGEKAVAQGYRKNEVKILPVNFSQSQFTFKPIFQTEETASGRLQYNLEVTLIRATREEMVLSVIRKFGRNDFANNTVRVPLIPGATFELTKEVYVEGMPRIFATMLERPTQETAIVAIGPKESA